MRNDIPVQFRFNILKPRTMKLLFEKIRKLKSLAIRFSFMSLQTNDLVVGDL